jgi:hypothetical protein
MNGHEEDIRRHRRNASNAQTLLLVLVAELAAWEACVDRYVLALRIDGESGPVCLLDLVENDACIDAALRKYEHVRLVLGDDLTDQLSFGVLGVPEEERHQGDTVARTRGSLARKDGGVTHTERYK